MNGRWETTPDRKNLGSQPGAERSKEGGCRVPIDKKVRFLGDPGAYPDRPVSVDVKETHMSWVFLADHDVYKLKKPVTYPFLDFGTLTAREADCRNEVRLNRRLAPGIYLGVRALTREPGGGLAIGGKGEIVDWLVHMRRLPAERMLDAVILRHELTPDAMEPVVDLLETFYSRLPAAALTPDSYVERFRADHARNIEVLERSRFALDGRRLSAIDASMQNVLDRHGGLLRGRVRQGRIVEGHGDLRPEHVCLCTPPVIIDCLEFNRSLRLVDPFEEIVFLGLECSRLGAGWVGDRLRHPMEQRLDDHPDPRLVAFYTAFRACLRARLALAHLLEPAARTPDRWPALAREYLDIAESACRRLTSQAVRRSSRVRGAAGLPPRKRERR